MAKKKKNKEKQPPVITGHDARPWEREENGDTGKRTSDAPDGVSGNWG